jgi:hypothetical protein
MATTLRNAGFDHVAASRPSEIVKLAIRNSGLCASGLPCFAKVAHWLAFHVEDVLRELRFTVFVFPHLSSPAPQCSANRGNGGRMKPERDHDHLRTVINDYDTVLTKISDAQIQRILTDAREPKPKRTPKRATLAHAQKPITHKTPPTETLDRPMRERLTQLIREGMSYRDAMDKVLEG